jgi:hypothetical protein
VDISEAEVIRPSIRQVDGRWRYRRKRVAFDCIAPQSEGWDHGRFSLPSAAATYGGHR